MASPPALAVVRPEPVEPVDSRWAVHLDKLAPAAGEAARRVLLDSLALPAASDPSILGQLAVQAVGAAAVVAADPAVDGRDRAAAVTDARRIVEVLAGAQERAEARRARWWRSAGSGLVVVLALLVLGRPLP